MAKIYKDLADTYGISLNSIIEVGVKTLYDGTEKEYLVLNNGEMIYA